MKYSWYRLDSSAIIYHLIQTPHSQSLFRLGVKLTKPVDPDALRGAVDKAFLRHPYFKCEIKRGFFRPYLDENNQPFPIEQDDGLLLKLLDYRKNNRYLLRVTYFGTRIFIDYFHGLCDATGALGFLKTVLFYYCEAANVPLEKQSILTLDTPSSESETEDAFGKYYHKPDFNKGVQSMAGGTAYQVKGKRFSYGGYGLIQATVSTESLLAAAHRFGVSVTVFLTALMLYSISKAQISGSYKGYLTAFVPINLRRFFPSETLKNFTVFAKIVIPKDTPDTLEGYMAATKRLLAVQLDEKELNLKLGFSTLMATMPFLRYMPLIFKGFFSRIGRKFSTPKQTFILSNLGKIDLGKNDLIDSFLFNLNCNSKTPDNVAVVSYNDKTVISFTRKVVSTEIERVFLSTLAEHVDNVDVISNFREDCRAL